MSTKDPNWSDDGFDSIDDGFLPRQKTSAEPVSAFQSPMPPPPIPTPRSGSSPKRAILLLILFFITAIGLVVTWVTRGPQPGTTGKVEDRPAVVVKPKPEVVDLDLSQDTPENSAGSVEPSTTVSATKPVQHALATTSPTSNIAKAQRPVNVEEAVAPSKQNKAAAPAIIDQPKTRTTPSTTQEWCVQVFASTNPDDADEWNNRLKAKNIDDSRIEMIERQGQLWYRVRFGRYNSRQEAEQVAQSMGFRNAWVNRAR